jgi:UDP-2-acetamido-3-amino-2,3-dideoxy-glucuronate N-acetyltransferase
MLTRSAQIHPTAEVAPDAIIGAGTRIWHQAQVREEVRIGEECIIGKGVYIDRGVILGNRVKVQNYASLYHGAWIDDGVFIGPYACLANDKYPRAIRPDGRRKGPDDWTVGTIRIGYGAAIGAHATVLPGVTIGPWALVGAGAVVSRDVPAHGLVVGNPARLIGFVCACGRRLTAPPSSSRCPHHPA